MIRLIRPCSNLLLYLPKRGKQIDQNYLEIALGHAIPFSDNRVLGNFPPINEYNLS
jgi:hypothetical protein